jgi:hypothetical protein
MHRMTDDQKAAEYYRVAAIQSGHRIGMKPTYVPSRVRVPCFVRGDGPFAGTRIQPGDYDCTCNQYGAVSVRATNGEELGLKLYEFEPIAWRENDSR